MKISAKELKQEMDRGEVGLVDVRTPAEYGEMHIEGSRLMPLDRLEPDQLKEGSWAVVCRSGKRAEQARQKLAAAGCEQVKVLEGGVLAWDSAGLPLLRGKAMLSLERQVRIGAGSLVLLGVLLGTFVHGGFYALAGFVGAGLTFAGLTDWCGMAMVLAKAPWNQRAGATCQGNSCSL